MRLAAGIQAIGYAAFLNKSNTLILSDLHIGAEATLVNQGILMPRTQQQTMLQRLRQLLAKTRPQKVVLLGDIKHHFGKILQEEWRETLQFLDELLQKDIRVHVVLGNHDNMLKPILEKRDITHSKHLIIDNLLLIHGDEEPALPLIKQVHTILCGHVHPSVTLSDGVRKEKYKAFYKGRYKDKDILFLPSFYPLVQGTDVLASQPLGPLLRKTKHLEAYVVANIDEVLYFGALQEIQRNI